MRKIKICYTERDNLGDSINPLIFKKLLGERCFINSDPYSCDISGIGSGLRRFFIPTNVYLGFKDRLKRYYYRHPLYLFSAGFLSTPSGEERVLRKNINIISVRGELSRKWISKILGKEIICSTGDAGLLASELLDYKIIKKKYDVGIIPHDKEREEPFFKYLQNIIPNSIIIDVRGDAITRIKEIASCRTIISSSLHGLIIADSLFIPNLHIRLTNNLSGDGFKFRDYYSSFDLDDYCIDLNQKNDIDMRFIKENYRLTIEQIENKKEEILNAFKKIKELLLRKGFDNEAKK